ncbi:MarR family winged helix-turn-helix transcriptional regulator [Micromonospora halophytica]|uniref:DNA-binding transcriptional regulator, MarR family n=1 Tax=Micromonospora halophytica TaxID=47864 RepID=A0A1C5H6R2_9ACTN|nr:MarR family transcriptional regulator [Micromonospora halophytica]SCG41708.1 DNA-binding transcriptional regulator, MarR family [Micromonospora halophytica]
MEGAASTGGRGTAGVSHRGPYSEAPTTSETARALREVLRAAGDTRGALARRLGIGTTDAAAIDHLISSPVPLGPVELGNRLGIRSASATTLVDRLVQAGHVERGPHPSDRRRLSLQVTERAYDEVLAALRPMLTGVEQAVARLTPEQAAATTAFLREVATVMREYVATAPDEPRSGPRPD